MSLSCSDVAKICFYGCCTNEDRVASIVTSISLTVGAIALVVIGSLDLAGILGLNVGMHNLVFFAIASVLAARAAIGVCVTSPDFDREYFDQLQERSNQRAARGEELKTLLKERSMNGSAQADEN